VTYARCHVHAAEVAREPTHGQPVPPVSNAHAKPALLARPSQVPLGDHCAGQQGAGAGRPLDAATRGYFEPRFGQDFSHVRVHTDAAAQASAASHGALAYAAGRDVVFANGQYRPHTTEGRWLIAHELAHVVQQRGGTPSGRSADRGLEKEADRAAVSIALGGSARVAAGRNGPAAQFARVSGGGFGKALEEYTNEWKVEDRAVTLLTKSKTFMALVDTLDRNYVWFDDPAFNPKTASQTLLELGPDGRAVKPPSAAGKRTLRIMLAFGSRFVTVGSPDNERSMDIIGIESPDTPIFIQRIAHEATHAAHAVGAAAPPPKTLTDEINAGINEEIGTRKSEAQVVKEVSKDMTRPERAGFEPVGALTPREVERDFTPGFNLTYMELFYFGRELREAQAAEKLDEAAAGKLRDEISSFHGAYSTGLTEHHWAQSRYGRVWWDRVTAQREWQSFMEHNKPSDHGFAAKKETMLQNHAKWFFYGKVSYLP
jgi:hypothetical protein